MELVKGMQGRFSLIFSFSCAPQCWICGLHIYIYIYIRTQSRLLSRMIAFRTVPTFATSWFNSWGVFWGINNQIPSVSKSNQLHVVIFWGLFMNFEAYSINSSRMMVIFPEVLNLNWLFLILNWFNCN